MSEVLLCLFVSQNLGDELHMLQDAVFMCTVSSFVIVHNLLKIKPKLSQIKRKLIHKLCHQDSGATFKHLDPNIFSLQEDPP